RQPWPGIPSTRDTCLLHCRESRFMAEGAEYFCRDSSGGEGEEVMVAARVLAAGKRRHMRPGIDYSIFLPDGSDSGPFLNKALKDKAIAESKVSPQRNPYGSSSQ